MKMHENPAFSCLTCRTLFKYKSNLLKHIKKGRCVQEAKEAINVEHEAKVAREQFIEITKNFGKCILDRVEVKEERFEQKIVKITWQKNAKAAKSPKKSPGAKKESQKIEKSSPETRKSSRLLKAENNNVELENSLKNYKIIDIGISSTTLSQQEDLNKLAELGRDLKNILETQKNLKKSPANPDLKPKRSIIQTRARRLLKFAAKYSCDLCSFTSLKKSQLLSHIRFHIASTRHTCKICPMSFTSFEKLHTHSIKTHKKGAFGAVEYSKVNVQCEICFKILSAERFVAHLRLHQAPKFQCDFCGFLFRTKQALLRHMKSRHNKEFSIACSTCGKNVKKESLKAHEATHNPVKIYVKCEVCHKLMQMKNLKLHIEMRHGDRYKEKNFICECGKAFRYEKQLNKHIEQVHKKVNLGKIYECEGCDFSTTRLNALRLHSFEHYSGPVFECAICKQKFKTKKLLKLHSVVHVDKELQRQYTCSKCQYVFKTSGGRRKHESRMHGSEMEIFTVFV